ncbi:hypothetical protein CWB73_06885, partial [Pseudoalteromonas phenolica]
MNNYVVKSGFLKFVYLFLIIAFSKSPYAYENKTLSGILTNSVTDTAPTVSGFTASVNNSGVVSGSITISHANSTLDTLRIHYCNSDSYNCGNQYIDLTKRTGTRTFNFDASQYAGERVYYKAEVKSSAGTQTLPPPSGSVNIPAPDSAPVVSDFTASVNSAGLVSGSITISHANSTLDTLRIHYCNSDSYNCGNQYIDLTKRTGTRT